MRHHSRSLCLLALACVGLGHAPAQVRRPLDLARGWSVFQDVHETGETLRMWRRDTSDNGKNTAVSDWQPIARLDYLQLLFAPQPYFGRELRYFNQAPWWYRVEFPTPAAAAGATLRDKSLWHTRWIPAGCRPCLRGTGSPDNLRR